MSAKGDEHLMKIISDIFKRQIKLFRDSKLNATNDLRVEVKFDVSEEYKDAVLAVKALYEDILAWIKENYKLLNYTKSNSRITEYIYFTNLADKKNKRPRVISIGLAKLPNDIRSVADFDTENFLDEAITQLKEFGYDTTIRPENVRPHRQFIINSKQEYKSYEEAFTAVKKWIQNPHYTA